MEEEKPAVRIWFLFQGEKRCRKCVVGVERGVGNLLDCGANILGQAIAIVGLLAILSTMELGFILLFASLAIVASLIESKAMKKSMSLSMEVV